MRKANSDDGNVPTPSSPPMTGIPFDDVPQTGLNLRSPLDTLGGANSLHETCPDIGIIYTQNVQGLSGKDRELETLLDTIVELTISQKISAYCIQ